MKQPQPRSFYFVYHEKIRRIVYLPTEYLLANATIANKLFGDPHRIAMQQFREEGAKSCAIRKRKHAVLEFIN